MKNYKNWYFPDTETHFINYLDKSNLDTYQKKQRDDSLKFVQKKRNAIDIGANIGLWARDLCLIFDKVNLFEPQQQNIECLRKNLEGFSNFDLFEYALSNKNGTGELYVDDKGLGNNSLIPTKESTRKEVINLMKLDNYNFKDIDYIKIDVQYHELEVIEGGIELLKSNSPVLCIEAARRNDDECSYVNKFANILFNLDYKIVGGLGKELFFKR